MPKRLQSLAMCQPLKDRKASWVAGFGECFDAASGPPLCMQYGTSVQFEVLLDREQCLKDYAEGGTGWGATFSEVSPLAVAQLPLAHNMLTGLTCCT